MTPTQNTTKQRLTSDKSIVMNESNLETRARTRRSSIARFEQKLTYKTHKLGDNNEILDASFPTRKMKPRRTKRPRRRQKVLVKNQKKINKFRKCMNKN